MNKHRYSEQTNKFPQQKFLEIGPDNGKKVKIYLDGSIEATAFKDGTDGQMEYVETPDKNVYFQKDLKPNTKIVYMPRHWNVLYKYICNKVFTLKNAFAKIVGEVRSFSILKLGRYKHAHKKLRREIKTLTKDKKRFVFTREGLFGIYTEPYVESTTLGPYNVPVKVKTENEIEFINDLIVIKTGSYDFNRMGVDEKIVYISPHILKISEGVFHTSTGVVGNYGETPATGQDVNPGIHDGEILRISSNNFAIPEGSYLSTDTRHVYYSDGGSPARVYYNMERDLNDTLFHALYPENILLEGEWDGVLPSGGYLKVESWSTNDQFCGFDGTLSVVPVDESLASDIDITYASHEEVVDPSYDGAVKLASKKAEKKFHNKIGKTLMALGHKHKSSKLTRYERMLNDSALANKHKRQDSDIRLSVQNPDLVDFMFPYSQGKAFETPKEKIWVSVMEGIDNWGGGTTLGSSASSTSSTSTSSASTSSSSTSSSSTSSSSMGGGTSESSSGGGSSSGY